MKNLLLVVPALALATGCGWLQKKQASETPEGNVETPTLSVAMERLSGSSETSWVLSAELVCADGTETLSFTKAVQKTVLYRSLDGCSLSLASFGVAQDGGAERVYERTDRTSGAFHAFDATESGGVVDTKLAKKIQQVSAVCGDGKCNFSKVTASFAYSELLSESLVLANDLAVTKVAVGIEKEPAPSCNVTPYFEQNGFAEPELVFDFASCVDLFPSGKLEYTIFSHTMGQAYGIEELQAAISGDMTSVSATNGFQIRLTVAQLKAIAGTSNVFQALTGDLVIATRNEGGMSIKYYVIDNQCEDEDVIDEPEAPEGCETAFGFGPTTFVSLGLTPNRWGWQMGPIAQGQTFETPVYAGAGNNVVANATHVGNLTATLQGNQLVVSYAMLPGFGLKEVHIYAGANDTSTIAPGQLGNTFESLGLATSKTFTIPLASALASVKAVAHAVVCSLP